MTTMKKYFKTKRKQTLFALTSILLSTTSFAENFSGRAWVIDGDSLRLTLPDHTKKEVRIFGINAPEMPTDAGLDAKRHMIRLIKKGRIVYCTAVDTDRYKRTVSICTNSSGDLAENMLKAGHAIVYKRFIKNAKKSLQKRYFKAEEIGKEFKQ